jgi:hypothetical protein
VRRAGVVEPAREPRIPVGMLAMTINHARRYVGVWTRRVRSVRTNAAMISSHSRQ